MIENLSNLNSVTLHVQHCTSWELSSTAKPAPRTEPRVVPGQTSVPTLSHTPTPFLYVCVCVFNSYSETESNLPILALNLQYFCLSLVTAEPLCPVKTGYLLKCPGWDLGRDLQESRDGLWAGLIEDSISRYTERAGSESFSLGVCVIISLTLQHLLCHLIKNMTLTKPCSVWIPPPTLRMKPGPPTQ